MKSTQTLEAGSTPDETGTVSAQEQAQAVAQDETAERQALAAQRRGAATQLDFNSRRHTVEQNLEIWNDEYDWSLDGDEWSGQARYCAQPYERWKQSIIESFILPYISPTSTVLEVAAGHGRWSREIVDRCGHLIMLDLCPTCIRHCEDLFAGKNNVSFVVNDGKTLADIGDGGVDFVWSFDSFVHMGASVIDSYLGEMRRVLKEGGTAVIHHPGRRHHALPLKFLRNMGTNGRRLYKLVSMGRLRQDDGWRSDISRETVARLAQRNGLTVRGQFQRWGPGGQFTLDKYGDCITVMYRQRSL